MKYKLLIGLAIQSSIYNILIHHASLSNYNPVNVIVLGNSIQLVVCCVMVYRQESNIRQTSWKPMIIPSVLSLVSHQCIFFGMVYLEPSLFQMIYQTNIIFTSLITTRTLNFYQRCSILLLFFGICTVLWHRPRLPAHSPLKGMLFTVVGAATSALESQTLEDVLKSETDTTWIRELQLVVFGLLFNLPGMYNYKFDVPQNFILILVLIKCVGDIILPFVLKHADNVTRSISNTMATFVALILSRIIYHWQPDFGFYIGSVIIFIGAYTFIKYDGKQSPGITIQV